MLFQHIYKPLNEQQGIIYCWFSAMHTRVDIVLCNGLEKDLLEVANAIYAEIIRIEKIVHFFNPSSQLYQLNHSDSSCPISVENELLDMIKDCKEWKDTTYGYFDISFRSENHNENTLDNVTIYDNNFIYFSQNGILLDFSGYAKGYALDKIKEILKENNIQDALINIGNSSVMAMGNHPDGKGWKINYQENEASDIVLQDECLSTSGNETEDRKHIYDPISKKYKEGKTLVSVITSTGTAGEVLSTALFAATDDIRNKISDTYKVRVYYN